jgi:hypothetical protein
MFGVKAFEDLGSGANTVFVGAIAHHNEIALGDGLCNHLTIVREGDVLEHPGSTVGALLEMLVERESW